MEAPKSIIKGDEEEEGVCITYIEGSGYKARPAKQEVPMPLEQRSVSYSIAIRVT